MVTEPAPLLVHSVHGTLETAGCECPEPQRRNPILVTRNANHGNRSRVEDRAQFLKLPFVQKHSYVTPVHSELAQRLHVMPAPKQVYPPSEGSVRFLGQDITGRRPNRIVKAGIARTFQNIRLFSELAAIENAAAGLHCRTRSGPISAIWRGRAQRDEETRIWARSSALLRHIGLADRASAPAKTLPYGGQRRLEIARALAAEPRLLVLDEPAAGLSSSERSSLLALISELRARGLAILLIEHDMDFVMTLSDYVHVLNYGREIAQGTPEQVQNNAAVIEAYLGRPEET